MPVGVAYQVGAASAVVGHGARRWCQRNGSRPSQLHRPRRAALPAAGCRLAKHLAAAAAGLSAASAVLRTEAGSCQREESEAVAALYPVSQDLSLPPHRRTRGYTGRRQQAARAAAAEPRPARTASSACGSESLENKIFAPPPDAVACLQLRRGHAAAVRVRGFVAS